MCVGCGNFLHRPLIVAKLIMKAKALPPVELLRERFDYDPETGELRWRVTLGGHIKAGEMAGSVDLSGYRVVRISGALHKAHRICWALYYGEDPHGHEMDHIDRDKTNNSINNLRLVTRETNCFNRDFKSVSSSGHRNIYIKRGKRGDKFIVRMRGKNYPVCETLEDALKLRDNLHRCAT